MTPERWREVTQIYGAVLSRATLRRSDGEPSGTTGSSCLVLTMARQSPVNITVELSVTLK